MTPPRLWTALCLSLIVSGCSRSGSAAASATPVAPRSAQSSAQRSYAGATTRPATPSSPTAETTPLGKMHASMVDALKPIVVGHASMDGQVDACHTTFTTSRGGTTIAWAEVGNVAAHLSPGRREIGLKTAGATHTLSVPTRGYPEADAAGVDGAVGQLAGECGAY